MLVGRELEQRRLDSLLQDARDERSAVLVLRGEPGIGKTALLDYAVEQAEGMNVLTCVGIEAEHELPFAAMHQLVRPHLELIDRLPQPQARALRGALGLSADVVEDRFLVMLGLLSLLAETCTERPTLCCVDDAQWLDAPSAEALVFAARRFEAEPIAVLLAVREGELRRFDAPGLPVLEIRELGADDSRALLRVHSDAGASAEVLEMVLGTARGNPLALLELPAALTRGQLQGSEQIFGPPPVRPAVEEAFRTRVAALSKPTEQVLVMSEADESGDLGLIREASARLGLDAGAELDVAARAGLVRLNGAVVFRHPLLRSVVYRAAPRGERKAAHEALASVVRDPTRAAWHRALVADGVDETIAADLEEAGWQAAARAAHATASVAFERAAELSESATLRGHRLQRAAQACVDAGRPDTGLALAERAQPLLEAPMDQANLNLVRSAVAGRRGTPREAYDLVTDAAEKLAEVAPDVAVEMALFTVAAGFQGGWGEQILGEVRERIERIASEGETKRFAGLFLEGSQALVAGDHELARERVDAAMEIAERLRSASVTDFGAGPLLFYSVFICMSTGDLARAHRLLAETLAEDRAHGGVAVIVAILPLCALMEVTAGRLSAASALLAEGLEIADQLGFDNDRTAMLAIQARVAAIRGREQECREFAGAALQRGTANGVGWAVTGARVALAHLELGLGNASEAVKHLDQIEPSAFPPQGLLALPDLVDAALRAGERKRAKQALARFAAWAPLSRESLVPGMLARCRAMLADDAEEAERLFEEALTEHAGDVPTFERARTQLAYGERLRRDRSSPGRSSAPPWTPSRASVRGCGPSGLAESSMPPVRARGSGTRALATTSRRRSSG